MITRDALNELRQPLRSFELWAVLPKAQKLMVKTCSLAAAYFNANYILSCSYFLKPSLLESKFALLTVANLSVLVGMVTWFALTNILGNEHIKNLEEQRKFAQVDYNAAYAATPVIQPVRTSDEQ